MSYPFRPFPDQMPFPGGKKPKAVFLAGGMAALILALAAPADAGRVYASASFTLGFPNGHITVGPVLVARQSCDRVVRREVVVEKVVTHVPYEDEYVDEIREYHDDCPICRHAGADFDDDAYVVENRVILSDPHRCRRHAKVVIVHRDEYPDYFDREIRVVNRPNCDRNVVVMPPPQREVVVVRPPERQVVVVRPPQRHVVVVPPRRDITVIHHDNGRHNGWDKKDKEHHDNGRHNGWSKKDKEHHDRGYHRGWDKSDKGHGDRSYDRGGSRSGGLFTPPARPSRERGVRNQVLIER